LWSSRAIRAVRAEPYRTPGAHAKIRAQVSDAERREGSVAARVAIRPGAFVLVGVLAALSAGAAEPVNVVVLDPAQGRLQPLLEREVALAAERGKVPFLQVTAEWCAPCRALRASLGDPRMQDAFAGTYIIQVDYDSWKNELAGAGIDSPAIPVFFAMDGAAKPSGAKIDGGAWGEDIPANMAPPLERFFRANHAGRSSTD
jgi:thiol:disulfide interchange protein